MRAPSVSCCPNRTDVPRSAPCGRRARTAGPRRRSCPRVLRHCRADCEVRRSPSRASSARSARAPRPAFLCRATRAQSRGRSRSEPDRWRTHARDEAEPPGACPAAGRTMRADTVPRSCPDCDALPRTVVARRRPTPRTSAHAMRRRPAPSAVEGAMSRVAAPHLPLAKPRRARAGGEAGSGLPIELRAELNLTRCVAHARDAREVSRVIEIQRTRQIECRRVRNVEDLQAYLESVLSVDPQLPRDAHVELPQRRASDLTARTAEWAEIGLTDRGDGFGIRERSRVVELVHAVAPRVRIPDDQRVTAGAGSARHGAVDGLRLPTVERQHPVGPPAAENRALARHVVVAAEDQRMLGMEARETDVVREIPADNVRCAKSADASA